MPWYKKVGAGVAAFLDYAIIFGYTSAVILGIVFFADIFFNTNLDGAMDAMSLDGRILICIVAVAAFVAGRASKE